MRREVVDVAEQPNNPNPDEYELVAHNQLEYLRREVEKIKRNPFGETQSSKDLLSSMADLNANVAKLVAIFETANDEIVRDYKDHANTERLNRVLDQNEKLAKGIVAIADLLRELKEARAQPQDFSMAQPATRAIPDGFSTAPGQRPVQDDFSMAPPQEQSPQAPPQDDASQPGEQNPFLEQRPPATPRRLPPINYADIPPPPR